MFERNLCHLFVKKKEQQQQENKTGKQTKKVTDRQTNPLSPKV